MVTEELQTIYIRLMRVESKCKELREAESDSRAPFDNKKWQGLVKVHQALLHEHHEFFRASQHLTTIHVLERLPEIYATPMRLWRYSIHSFLELLRHRLPDSREHMLSYINFAYSMMSLLRETVPKYQSTWAEALGNLSEYSMKLGILDVEEREVWTKTARSWYTKAADVNPDVGRIQYHLAILARPHLLQQLFYYTKSLVSVRSFAGTRQRIQDLFHSLSDNRSPDPELLRAFVAAHGALFNQNADSFLLLSVKFLSRLDKYITRIGPGIRMQGVYIASCNFAAVLEYSSANALLRGECHRESTQPQNWTSDARGVVLDFVALGDPQDSSRFVFYRSFFAFQTMSVFLDQIYDEFQQFGWCLEQPFLAGWVHRGSCSVRAVGSMSPHGTPEFLFLE